jgi:hypothetical protein
MKKTSEKNIRGREYKTRDQEEPEEIINDLKFPSVKGFNNRKLREEFQNIADDLIFFNKNL